jgi:hypothetical protein
MKKLVCLFAVIALTAPLYAAVGDPNVDFVCEDLGSGVCQVNYEIKYQDGLDPGALVRGFALDIEITGDLGTSPTITSISSYDGETPPSPPDESDEILQGYPIHITNIDFGTDPNNVNDYGSPITTSDTSLGGLGTAGMTVEFASLYDMNATTPTPPPSSGILCNFTVDFDGSAEVTVTITANALRGEIVMEDLQHAEIGDSGCTLSGLACMADGHPDFDVWQSVGSPDCWCYERNCRGDTNDAQEYDMFWVLNIDVDNYAAAYGQTVMTGNMICADFARDIEYDMFRVLNNDLPILVTYYGDTATPPCSGPGSDTGNGEDTGSLPNSHFNFWTHP